ncbi:protein TIC 20-II, chloroplastic-like [Chenopodium quinoa]|uniref:protein TIC 20-II, chloroplastic-like n=1 Tax=Chenopodium quinoa TaxID=63459 RepID=UPI000B78EB3A|nr:protein TIC 20-II, chloroplastic-like [Chenopodium quinoa]
MASIPLLRLSLLPTAATTTTHHRKPIGFRPLSLLFHPLKPSPITKINFPITTQKPKTLKPQKSTITMSTTPATDRLISSISYFLPFINGLHYGRFLFAQYPPLSHLFQPLLPFFSLYKSIPYASFVSFFALYLGVVRNPSFSSYVRFNAMQALVLDVLLVLPLLLQRIFTPGKGLGFKIMVMGHNFLFVFIVSCFVYGVVSSILGRTPYLPIVADAAGRQM